MYHHEIFYFNLEIESKLHYSMFFFPEMGHEIISAADISLINDFKIIVLIPFCPAAGK